MMRVLVVFGLVLWAALAEAATCYVRDGGTATGTQGISTNGGSWSQAYDQLTTAETNCARGDTIYVADGTYTGVTFNTAASGTTLITIKKATIADHGTSTGWLDTYGDGVADFSSTLYFSTSYWLLDCITGGGPGSWTTGFGCKITVSTGPGIQAPASNGGATLSNVTVRHVEIEGNGGDGDGAGDSNDGIATYPNRLTDSLFEYFYIHDMGRTIYILTGQDNVTFRYHYTGPFESTGGEHAELASIWASSGLVTFEYCVFTHIEGTGGLIWDNQGSHTWQLRVHGSVFVKRAGSPAWSGANGIISGWSGGGGEDFANVKVYNNTFIDTESGGDALGSTGVSVELNEARNNLFYSVGSVGGGADWATISHNHFISTTTNGTSTSTGTGDPFVDWANLDFRLTANTTAGVDLGAPYNVDMYGNTRATWTRGAIEYVTGGGGGSPTGGLDF